jgi:hypothetical protein
MRTGLYERANHLESVAQEREQKQYLYRVTDNFFFFSIISLFYTSVAFVPD